MREARDAYATDFADRMLHDRQLCAYTAELVVRIGFDGDFDDTDRPRQWVDRVRLPERIKTILRARDRGKCSVCGVDLINELEADVHIDHIVPLARGGCNDVVNLQLLCAGCNLRKSARDEQVLSSVPEYIKRHRGRARRDGA